MAAEKVPAFQFYPKDFLADSKVMSMSLTERGIYITLLCFCWTDKTLPLETESLARMLKLPLVRFTKLWENSIVKTCFQVNADGCLHHARLDQERDKQESYRRRQSDSGKKRWDKPAISQPQASLCPRDGDGEEDQSLKKDGRAISAPPVPVTDDTVSDRARDLLERYPKLYAQHRHGARLALLTGPIHFQKAEEICRTWPDDERIDKMIAIFLVTDDDWISSTDRGFAVFHKKASWCDDRLRSWEVEQAKKRAKA